MDLRILDDEDDEGADDGCEPWALGDEEPEGLDRRPAVDEEIGAADRWLDAQLSRRSPSERENGASDLPSPAGSRAVVLRRPASTRPARRRTADADAAADLPTLSVPGYVRDRRGTWRYRDSGQAVPGARDLTLRSLHRFPVRRDQVLVPVDQARSEDELAWCMNWKHTLTTSLSSGRVVTVLRIPLGEWERRADIPIGLWAPELSASRLLGVTDVARFAGVTPATITAYLSRRRMPPPVTRIGNSPVWTRPVIQQWLVSRPGQGARPRH